MNGNEVLEKLFTSRARVKLLSVLLLHPERSYYMRELAKVTEETFSNVRRELKNLEELEIIQSQQNANARYYHINKSHYLYPDLKGIIQKSKEKSTDTK